MRYKFYRQSLGKDIYLGEVSGKREAHMRSMWLLWSNLVKSSRVALHQIFEKFIRRYLAQVEFIRRYLAQIGGAKPNTDDSEHGPIL